MHRGSRLAAQAPNREDSTEPIRVRAEGIYDESLILQFAVDNLDEWRRLELRLVQFREVLDRRSAPDELRAQPAYS